jgi:hypothetical protein
MRNRVLCLPAAVCAVAALTVTALPLTASASGYGAGPGPVPTTPYGGFNPALARAPYVTDLTQTSAVVTWATNPDIHGTLYYGPPGNCTANSIPVASGAVTQVRVSPNPTTTYPTRYDYQSSVAVTGLTPGTTYCYEVFGSGKTAVDLLPAPQPSATFTTLDPAGPTSAKPLTFDVIGDFGETTDRGTNTPSSVNSNQAAIDSLIGSSGARFAVAVGDIGYNDGGNYNYGDLDETGASVGSPNLTEISDIFGPRYWPLTGGIPLFAADGNHGQNSNILTTWPGSATASNSGGKYAMQQYSSVDGISTASYPSDWYAFSSGDVRFYILDGSWTDANVGTASGSACPDTSGTINCMMYQVDADAHFLPGDAEYQWLGNDLRAHPGGIKLAFFHFPLRSDNSTEDSDVYLQHDLEPLLAENGVDIAFSGHAHDYERNTAAGPNSIVSYVTGGGGGVVQPVAGKGCSPWDAYAIGWSYGAGRGSGCGAAKPAPPTSDAQVYNFLKVTVSGDTVTVQPVNAAGQVFDTQTYTFTPPSTLLTTGFESGTLAGWSPAVGQVAVQTGVAHTGSYAVRLSSTGGQAYALQNLARSSSTLYAQAWVNVAGHSTAMTVFGLRTQATATTPAYQVAQVYLAANGTIKVLNNVTKASYLGNTALPPGGWHEITFGVNQTAGTMQVWLDGAAVQFSTATGWNPVVGGQNLGTVPMSNFQLGDDSTGRSYSWYADDLTVATEVP